MTYTPTYRRVDWIRFFNPNQNQINYSNPNQIKYSNLANDNYTEINNGN